MKKYFLLLSLLLAVKSALAVTAQTRMQNAELLGWVTGDNVCGGHFGDPPIPGGDKPLPPLKSTPVSISANSAQLNYTGISTLSGDVELSQPGRIVNSHQASLVTD